MNIFILHRDFRIHDNKGLIALSKEEKEIYLIFILTNEQIKNNKFFNLKSFQAMIFCLKQLNKIIHVNVLKAENELNAIRNLLNQGMIINKIYTNKDFSPYALERSQQLKNLAKEIGFIYREFHDYMLFAPHEIKKDDGSFYQIFTPYWNAIKTNKFNITISKTPKFQAMKLPNCEDIKHLKTNDFNLPLTREKVEVIVTRLSKDYQNQRDKIDLIKNSTSNISIAIKYGIVSIREVHFWAIQRFGYFDNSFSRQLIWRDFFYQATYNAMIEKKWKFGTNWIEKMNDIIWDNNIENFKKWRKGETGIPLIDAGMNELNNHGTMHNRVRMVCGSYLVKNLNIDWRWGEKYFAQKLIDYDPIVNQCSWQWVAGTGFDAQQYIRIFNPYLQQIKYDPNFIYINNFLSRTKNIEEIIDFKKSVQEAKKRYQNLKSNIQIYNIKNNKSQKK